MATYYESARGVKITFKRAMQEIDRHGIIDPDDRADFHAMVKQDKNGDYNAQAVLEWLGY